MGIVFVNINVQIITLLLICGIPPSKFLTRWNLGVQQYLMVWQKGNQSIEIWATTTINARKI